MMRNIDPYQDPAERWDWDADEIDPDEEHDRHIDKQVGL